MLKIKICTFTENHSYEYYKDPKTRALNTSDQMQEKLKEGEISKELLLDYKLKQILHPIIYASGLFRGSQLNWATLTKEAYAIYISVKKLNYYLEDADIILRSDHLPLKKFWEKNTLNTKVNNLAIEISPYKIQFEYIKDTI